uniref:Chromosome 12 open reading frame 4 n=1 Tax=Eptatretus burgeri TaxID=7764 RepID=A0A8C4R224_EPTBU
MPRGIRELCNIKSPQVKRIVGRFPLFLIKKVLKLCKPSHWSLYEAKGAAVMREDYYGGEMQVLERRFIFQPGPAGFQEQISHSIKIPVNGSLEHLCARIMEQHSLPCYVEDDLHQELSHFVRSETLKLQDKAGEMALARLGWDETGFEDLLTSWDAAYSKTWLCFAPQLEADVDGDFSEAYRTLIHSELSHPLLNVEHQLGLAVEQRLTGRTTALRALRERQSAEMERTIQSVGQGCTDEDVNILAVQHFEREQALEGKWVSETGRLMEQQKQEFRERVLQAYGDLKNLDIASNRLDCCLSHNEGEVWTSSHSWDDNDQENKLEEEEEVPRLEESFTIHLGAQQKTMHNLRLLRGAALDLCQPRHRRPGGLRAQRLQTALSVYSSNLSALVLLVDESIDHDSGIKHEFAEVCQQSTEFHFSTVKQQLETLQNVVLVANSCRQSHEREKGDKRHTADPSEQKKSVEKNLHNVSPGDVYVTWHSNLAEVQVIFHLCVDDEVQSGRMNARHPSITGLRNIIKEMSVSWCLKRAELVFKCVKGFMMEMASWDGGVSHTVQFFVPPGLSDDMFYQLSAMLPQIFRVASTLTLTTSQG